MTLSSSQQTVKFNRDQFSCLKSFQQTSEKYPVRKEEINTWGKIEQAKICGTYKNFNKQEI